MFTFHSLFLLCSFPCRAKVAKVERRRILFISLINVFDLAFGLRSKSKNINFIFLFSNSIVGGIKDGSCFFSVLFICFLLFSANSMSFNITALREAHFHLSLPVRVFTLDSIHIVWSSCPCRNTPQFSEFQTKELRISTLV